MAQPTRKKMYRTMQGRLIDIDKLRSSNETVRAVGNMSVNARGDVIGQGGRILKSKDDVMKDYYKAPKGRADDTPVKKEQVQQPIPKKQVEKSKVINPTVQSQPKTEQVKTKTTDMFKPKSGIDAALDGIE
jgi:hypothetical protein